MCVGLSNRRCSHESSPWQNYGQAGNELVAGGNSPIYLFSQPSTSSQYLPLTEPGGKEIQVVVFLRSISQATEQDIELGTMDLGRQMENNKNRKERFTQLINHGD